MRKNFQFGLEIGGLTLFLAVMLPNFLWFAVPAPNDVLRAASETPVLDGIASVCQALLVAALCLLRQREGLAVRWSRLRTAALLCVLAYYAGWCAYYLGHAGAPVILLLTVPPCLAFLLYAADRRNWAALLPAAVFAVCHILYGVLNFLV